ncbi:MAG TPA: choice-of-anchor D domain-containing protein [Terriglobales bacterium]
MRSVYIYSILALLCGVAWSQSAPVPFIDQPLVPGVVQPGSAAFTLTINGAGFTSGSEVFWNGSIRTTTYVSATQVQAQINAADVAARGFGWVTVLNEGANAVFSNVAYLQIGSPTGAFGLEGQAVSGVTSPGPIVAGDFNNDGILDFAVGVGEDVEVFLGKGDGTFLEPKTTVTKVVTSMVVGDFNGDGNLDIAMLNDCEKSCVRLQLRVFLGDGTGRFPTVTTYFDNFNTDFRVSGAADFNGDGKLDLYLDSPNVGGEAGFVIILGNGDGTFTDYLPQGRNFPPTFSRPAIGDFNGDGILDIAVSGVLSNGKNQVVVCLGYGNGYLSGRSTYPVPYAGDAIATADINGDGILDLVTDGVSVLLGKGDGTFKSGASYQLTGETGSVSLDDFNADGKLDIAAGLNVLLGNGNGTFAAPQNFAGLIPTSPLRVGPFNAASNFEMLGVSKETGEVSLFSQVPAYFTPKYLTFGKQPIDTTSSPMMASLTNYGSTAFTKLAFKFTGTNAADFAQTNNCTSTLAPGKTCQINVTFTPSVVGDESASLQEDYSGSKALLMPLSGTGTDQVYTVSLNPTSLTFPLLLVGQTSQGQYVTLTNTGNQPVNIKSIATAPPFAETNNCPATLEANDSCDIEVTFSPTDYGVVNGTLSVTDNAQGSPQKVTLSGTGTSVVISPTAINFGNQPVGTSSVPVPFTISNLGTSALTITQINIQGADPNDFSEQNNCGTSIPAQSKCTVQVTFTPTAQGARSANVSITDGDPTSPQSEPLSGKGT